MADISEVLNVSNEINEQEGSAKKVSKSTTDKNVSLKTKNAINKLSWKDKMLSYRRHPGSFLLLVLVLVSAVITVGILFYLVGYILIHGIPYLSTDLFALEYNSENVSMFPAMVNTLSMTALSLLLSVPFGVGAAIYLVEYAKKGNKLVGIVRVTAETLSGIPSIIYGLFGMLFFVTALKWNYSMLAGAATLAIMVLPTVMRTTEEALLCVPNSFREGSFGLGAGKLRTIFKIVLPAAVPGILSGIILAIGRIVGETAALIYTSGTVTNIAGLMGSGRTLSVHMYSLSREGMHTNEANATAVVLLIIVFIINGVSSLIAKKFEAPKQ